MTTYCVGDIHGCYTAFQLLLKKINFSPSKDKLYLLGDMINRGEDSLAVLRWIFQHSGSIECILGNHDIHVLAIANGLKSASKAARLETLLTAPDRDELLNWLRKRPLAVFANNVLMVHAGVLPQWSVQNTLDYAEEVACILRGDNYLALLQNIYGNSPSIWSDKLESWERLRTITNALTRIRYCLATGEMEFKHHNQPSKTGRSNLIPWFDLPQRQTANQRIAFGHWSTLGWQAQRDDIYALDTGCIWGGKLTAIEIDCSGKMIRKIQVTNPHPILPSTK